MTTAEPTVSSKHIGVCSAKPRPSVQKGAKGHQWWRRDVYHLLGDNKRTLCGIDCSEWLTIGPVDINNDCCARCSRTATSAS